MQGPVQQAARTDTVHFGTGVTDAMGRVSDVSQESQASQVLLFMFLPLTLSVYRRAVAAFVLSGFFQRLLPRFSWKSRGPGQSQTELIHKNNDDALTLQKPVSPVLCYTLTQQLAPASPSLCKLLQLIRVNAVAPPSEC